jgi:plasmid stabilization system protein ParE
VGAADVDFHPEAHAEALAALAWYAARSLDAAARFERELAAAVERIAGAPDRWPRHARVFRKLPLRRFPYLVIYRRTGDRVQVVAVAHGHRRPGYWRGR